MARIVHRTPRHLDDAVRLFGRSIPELVLLLGTIAVGYVLAWHVLPAAWDWNWRLTVGAVPFGLGVIAVLRGEEQGARSVAELPRRLFHALTTPRWYLPGPPHRGAHRFATRVGTVRRDPDDDE